MKRRLVTCALLGLLVILTPGCIYTNITSTLDTNLDNTELGSKVGKSSYQVVLLLFGWGDAGTQAAAQQGGITTLKHADVQTFSILWPIFVKRTTIVYGD